MASRQQSRDIILPDDVQTWQQQNLQHNGVDLIQCETISEALLAKPNPRFGSASKIIYADWLYLRVLWLEERGQPNHSVFFGSDNSQHWEERSKEKLRRQSWWNAFRDQQRNPLAWGHMAGWWMGAIEIMSRPQRLMDSTITNITFDGDNPFEFEGYTSGMRTRSPHLPASYYEGARSSQSSSSTSSNRSSPGGSKSLKRNSPTRSDELAFSAGSGGSHGGSLLGTESSNASGREVEIKLVNRFRPDEALINMSIVSLLQGIWLPTQYDGGFPKYQGYDWSITHRQFFIPIHNTDGRSKNVLTAKTDGYFRAWTDRDPDNTDVLAIIEVKPYRRTSYRNSLGVRIQEGAEMAAWIATESSKGLLPSKTGKYRRLLISQDFDEIYINIAEFDNDYIHYIRGKHSSLSIPISQDDSPTRRGRRDERDPRRSQKEDEENYKSKGKSSIASMFKSTSKSTAGSTIAFASSSASTGGFATPVKSASATITPQAPRVAQQGDRPIYPMRTGNTGFLRIHEYQAFRLDKPEHMAALFPLLNSLMEYLTSDHSAVRYPGATSGSQRR